MERETGAASFPISHWGCCTPPPRHQRHSPTGPIPVGHSVALRLYSSLYFCSFLSFLFLVKMKVFKCVFSGDELCSDSYEHLVPFGDAAFKDGRSSPELFLSLFSPYSLFFPSADGSPSVCEPLGVVPFSASSDRAGWEGVCASGPTSTRHLQLRITNIKRTFCIPFHHLKSILLQSLPEAGLLSS